MQAMKAHVKGGRLVLDEPTDLPDGEVVYLVPLDASIAQARAGQFFDGRKRDLLLDLQRAQVPSPSRPR